MSIEQALAERWNELTGSASLLVVPVGDPERTDRGILSFAGADSGKLGAAVRAAFAAVVLAAAITAAAPAHASGVGYDANVYGQAQGQVMQQGNATRMTILDVRPVKIEVAPQQRASGQATEYAITAAATAVGGTVGYQVANTSGGRQIGTILGGLAGMVAGNMANSAMRGPQEPSQIDGVELTMVNPQTNQVAAITQAGNQMFSRGDRVLVVMTGGTARVVPDRSQQQQYDNQMDQRPQMAPAVQYQQQQYEGQTRHADYRQPPAPRGNEYGTPIPLLHGHQLEQAVNLVVRSANTRGIQVDANKVASLLESGVGERDGVFVGKVVGIDPICGVVYQSTGRGMGVVHSINALNRVPALGEVATISMQNGRGMVNDGAMRGMQVGQGR